MLLHAVLAALSYILLHLFFLYLIFLESIFAILSVPIRYYP